MVDITKQSDIEVAEDTPERATEPVTEDVFSREETEAGTVGGVDSLPEEDIFARAEAIQESNRDPFSAFTIQGTGNDFSDKALAGQITAVRSFVEAREVGSQFFDRAKNDVLSSPNVGALVQTELEKYRGFRINEVIEAADPINTEASVKRIEQINEDISGPMAWVTTYVQAVSQADSNIEKEQIAEQFLGLVTQEIMVRDTTILQDIANFGALLIPDTPFDIAAATGGSVFNFMDDWTSIINGYRALPAEQKIAITIPLINAINETFDPINARSFVEDMFSSDEVSNLAFAGGLEVFDIATIGLSLTTTIIRKANFIRLTKKLANEELAGDLNAKAMTGDRAAQEAAGVDTHTAQMNTSGFAMGSINPGMTDGVAQPTVRALEKRLNEVDAQLAETSLEGSSLATDAERIVGKKAFFDDYGARLKNIEEERNIVIASEPKFVEDTLEGFNVKVTIGDGSEIVVPIRFQKGDLGKFEGPTNTSFLSKLTSPSVFLRKLGSNLVNVATRLGFTEAKNIEAVSKAYAIARKGIKKDGIERIDKVLIDGDVKGRVFTLRELLDDGILTPSGRIRLSEKEAETYFATRKIFDWLHMQKNAQIRRQLEFEGFGYVGLESLEGLVNRQGVFARGVKKSVLNDLKEVFDFDTKAMVDPKGTVAAKLKSDEYSLVRFKDPVRIEGADGAIKYISHGVVKKETIEGLPGQVLNYHPGYVPLIRKNTRWVARSKVARNIDGRVATAFRTEGFFDSQTEGLAWAAKQGDPDDIKITRDRELPDDEIADMEILQFGSLFGSARSKRKLFQGINEGDTTRINAFEALERNLSHVAGATPMNEFRLNLIEKFKKTAGPHLTRERDGSLNWQAPVARGTNIKTKESIERTREWIKEQLRIPSEAERRFEGRMNAIADAMDGNVKLDRIRKAVIDFGQTDPVGLVRSAAFHLLLGFWNGAQLLIQGMNASFAFSLAPLRAPRLLKEYSAVRMGMLVKQSPKALRLIARRSGINEDEFVKLIKDFDSTGLFQSVKTNADFGGAASGFRVDGGAIRRAARTNLIFFAEGERFGRGYAWLLARDNFRRANPGKKIGGRELASITNKSLAFTMNLNRANRAAWQKGWVSIPTQFFQVTTKFAENMLGFTDALTRTERAKIMLGQLGLFGVAGVPIGGSWLASSLLDSIGVNYNELDQKTQAFARGGAWEMAFELAFGVRIESNRFAVASGITEMLRGLTDENSSMLETMSGAFGTIPHRGFQAIQKFSILTADVSEFNWTTGEMIEAASIVGDIVSTFRNAHMAYTWSRLQQATDFNGKKLFDIPQGDYTHIITKGLGFQPARIQDVYTAKQFNRSNDEDMRNVVNGLNRIFKLYLAEGISAGTYQAAREALLESLPTQVLKDKAKKAFGKNAYDSKSEEQKAFQKALKNYLDSGSFTGSIVKPSSVGLTEQFGKEREEEK